VTTIELTASDEAEVEEFAGKLFAACLATMELANVELGERLGPLSEDRPQSIKIECLELTVRPGGPGHGARARF
jgi:hypothetical protein